jgi:hypothetical protein
VAVLRHDPSGLILDDKLSLLIRSEFAASLHRVAFAGMQRICALRTVGLYRPSPISPRFNGYLRLAWHRFAPILVGDFARA